MRSAGPALVLAALATLAGAGSTATTAGAVRPRPAVLEHRAAGSQAPAAFPSRLRAGASQIRDAAGAPVELRGFNAIPVWYEKPGATWAADDYVRMRRTGVTVVRFMLHWNDMEPRPGRVDDGHLRTLDRAIAFARAARIYVVLTPITVFKGDTFIPAWAKRGDALASIERHARHYIRTLGARYRDEAAIAGYDLVNEPPSYPPDQNRIMAMYTRLAAALRSVDPGRLVIVEPSYGDASMEGADVGVLRRLGNVVFSMHDYYLGGGATDGYLPDGQAETSWNGRARQTLDPGVSYDGRAADDFERHLQVNLRIMRRARIPVWIGEMGIDSTAVGAAAFVAQKLALYKRHGIGWAWWLYGVDGAFAPLDRSGAFRPFVAKLF